MRKAKWKGFYTIAYLRARCQANQDGCWIWQGSKADNGYGLVGRNQTGSTVVHKVMYILTFGMVPADLELDHTCRHRDCCNPEHLEPVTHLENMRRGVSRCEKLTECKRGHPFEDGSYYVWRGRKVCKSCQSIRHAEYRSHRSQRISADLRASDLIDELGLDGIFSQGE